MVGRLRTARQQGLQIPLVTPLSPKTHSTARLARTVLVLVAGTLVALSMSLAFAGPAGAATTACGKKVLDDWWDNGRVDRLYPLHCYEEAIDGIPADIRDYSDAESVISRALQSAVGGNLAAGGQDPSPDDDPGERDPGAPVPGGPEDPGTTAAPKPPLTSTVAHPRYPFRFSSSAACRSRCSPPAGSATSRVAAMPQRVRTTRTTRSTPSPDADVTKV